MKKQCFRKGIALGLTLTMLGSLAGCGNSPKPESQAAATSAQETTKGAEAAETTSGKQDVTTITLYPANANLQSGLVGGYKGDLFAEYGVALDVWAYSDEKTNAILASGVLPDVMFVTRDNLQVMIESGMILNLEEHLDKIPNLTGKPTVNTALDYLRNYYSAGTGQLYGVPTGVGEKVLEYGITKNMITINWDYYKGIGTPEFKDQWELIDVMKKMVEAYPAGDDGITNFGTYLNSGSDVEYWANMTQYFKWFGYEPLNLYYLLETDMVNAKYSSILEPDSKYYEGLKWYNTLYREGLLDPDSINTDRATQKAKVDNGHAMVSSGTLQGSGSGGYQPMFMPTQKLYQESWNSPYGTDYVMVISADSKNMDAALSFINMFADADAYLKCKSGPEGELWYAKDGVAYIKEDTVEKWEKGEISLTSFPLSTGEQAEFWNTYWIIDDSSFPSSYVDEEGNPRGVRVDRWTEIQDIYNNTESVKEWRALTGYDFWVEQAMDHDAYSLTSELDYVTNFTAIPDDTMKLTLEALKDVVVNASWQMVYAESDDQFTNIWNQMVEDCNGLGANDIMEWRLAELETAKQARDSLGK